MVIKNGAFLRGENLFNYQGEQKLLKQNGGGWAQEVWGTFVRSSNGSGKRKNVCVKILGNHQKYVYYCQFKFKAHKH